ncbi:MAG: hypothetical protein QXK06_04620 [Candidatus Diapherotrites archaeon]
MNFFEFLKDAFSALKSNPKLFVPKLFVAAVYGVEMVLVAIYLRDIYPLLKSVLEGDSLALQSEALGQAMPFVWLAFFWSVFSLFADIFVSAMYPVLVRDFKNKKAISLTKAFYDAKARAIKVIPMGFLIVFAFGIPTIAISTIASRFTGGPFLLIYLALAVVVSILVFFVLYYVFPVLMLEEGSAFEGLSRGFNLSAKNAALTLKASLFPLAISLLDLYLAFDIFNPFNFLLFVFTRFLIAIIAAYNATLEPILYFGVAGRSK